MDTFIARQPIFDRHGVVRAYELLFRTGLEPALGLHDPEQASSSVVAGSLLLPGLATLTEGRTAFVNATRDFVVRDLVRLLPPERTVVELVESVPPDAEVVAACRSLRAGGYRLALDDFEPGSAWEESLDAVDLVKVDVLTIDPGELERLARRLLPRGLTLVAEKVETREVHREVKALGYQLFQGYFFARPTTMSGRDIPADAVSCLRLLREVQKPELDLRMLESVVRRELGLAYKLLRYVNSALFGWRGAVRSIDHALALLGERELRRWASVVAVAGMASEASDELVRLALLRGRLCETLAPAAGLGGRAADLFLMGLFSVVDVILEVPMPELLGQLPLADDVRAALLGEPGPLCDLLAVAAAYAVGAWSEIDVPAARLGLERGALTAAGPRALVWCSAAGLGGELDEPAERYRPPPAAVPAARCCQANV